MTTRASWTLVLLLAVAAARAASASGSEPGVVDPKSCTPVPDRLAAAAAAIIGSDWPQYRPFTCLYPVPSPKGNVPLYVLALDVDRADEANSLTFLRGHPIDPHATTESIDPIPLPAIVGADGSLLGRLRDPFPNNAPASSSVRFSDWHDDFPRRFDVQVNDPTQDTAVPPPYCPPPWIWDAAKKQFVQRPGKYYVACARANTKP
jgi:hypothetical protein